jgi:SAM-dependent methyltransferase
MATLGEPVDSEDARLLRYYAKGSEGRRLPERSAAGRLEFTRTQELLVERLAPRSRVLDVGGGTGVHALPLQARGHEVVLIDPVAEHVEAARSAGLDARLGDARRLAQDDAAFDAVLLLGPLYHLSAAEDRAAAIAEAARVLRPRGWVFAAALSRFTWAGRMMLGEPVSAWSSPEVLQLLGTGTIPARESGFPGGHAHTAEELEDELRAGGFLDVQVLAVEGPGGLALDSRPELSAGLFEASLELARLVGARPGERDVSNHLIGIGRRP